MPYTHRDAITWLQEHYFPHVDYKGTHPDMMGRDHWHIFAIDTMAVPDDFIEKAKVTQAEEMDSWGDIVMYRLEYRKKKKGGDHVVDPAHIAFRAAPEDEPLVMSLDEDETTGFDPNYNQ